MDAAANSLNMLFTGMTAIASVVYAVFAILQWQTIRKQANLTDKTIQVTERAVDAANRNATAAFQAAEAADKNAHTAAQSLVAMKEDLSIQRDALRMNQESQRAWISLENLDVVQGIDPADKVIGIGFRNSGRAPARIIEANVSIRGSKAVTIVESRGTTTNYEDIDDLPEAPVYDPGVFVPPAVLVANQVSSMHHTVNEVTDENWNLLTLKVGQERRVFIYGYVRYSDGLSSNVRTYGWARVYDVRKSKLDPPKIRFTHVNKPSYNYAD